MIYTPAEFGGVIGQITSVGFYVNSLSTPGAMTNVRVYMKTRPDLFSAAGVYATETTGATLVYGPTTIASSALTAGQWFDIALTTPFVYNGTDNLEVIVEVSAGGGGNEGGTSKQFRYTAQANNTYFQYWDQDNAATPDDVGTRSANRPNVRFTVTEPPCVTSGLLGGTASSSVTASCSGAPFNVLVSGASTGGGLTYQWQSSADGSSWSDISGANSATLSTTQTAATYYRRKLTCSGTDAFSSSVLVAASAALTLPFTETFASYATTFPPSCWSRSSSAFILPNATSAYGDGAGSVHFDFYSTGSVIELLMRYRPITDSRSIMLMPRLCLVKSMSW